MIVPAQTVVDHIAHTRRTASWYAWKARTLWQQITESEEDWLERRRIAELNEYLARRL